MIYLVRSAGDARHPMSLDGRTEFIVGRAPESDVILDDPSVSRRHLRLRLLDGHVDLEDLDSSNGLWVDGKRVPSARLELGRWFAAGNVLLTVRHGLTFGSRQNLLHPTAPSTTIDPVIAAAAVGDALPVAPELAGFVTASESGRRLLSEIDRLAATSLPVLLLGESGTGKELLAHRVHRRSKRSDRPFVALNCAAFPKDLVEAELFGIQKGVATGVGERTGRFVQASGGTLFLDEVGDLPIDLQPKLLRALESGEVLPLGAPSPVKVDVRLVSATNAELREAVKHKLFRQDLLYRLAGAEVRVAPLRERPEDVLPLARHFAKEAAETHGTRFEGIDVDAASALIGYAWPGNVRELRHVIARALALADGPILHEELLPAEITGAADRTLGDALLGLREDWRTAHDGFARHYFTQLIARCGGNLTEAAKKAGLGRSTLYAKLGELGLKPPRDE